MFIIGVDLETMLNLEKQETLEERIKINERNLNQEKKALLEKGQSSQGSFEKEASHTEESYRVLSGAFGMETDEIEEKEQHVWFRCDCILSWIDLIRVQKYLVNSISRNFVDMIVEIIV